MDTINVFYYFNFNCLRDFIMKYMGSKNRIAKHLLPIMLSECEKHGITKWVEPFVGGCGMIDIS